MKKLTLFLVATLFSALSFAALNPYAYGLSSELDGTTLTVNYSLNAPATAVSVVIMDGETEVHTVACDGKTKGSHSVDISTIGLPTGKSLTWKVVVVQDTQVESPTIQDKSYAFYMPSSIAVDVDPESDKFGRWYAIEATRKSSNQTHTGYHTYEPDKNVRALYAFEATLDPIANASGTYGFTGGWNWGATETNANGDYLNLWRVTTSGGRVFIGKYRSGQTAVVEVNPDNLSANFTDVIPAGKRVVSIDAIGRGENLKLVMLDTDFNLTEYDLGTKSSISSASRTINKGALSIVRNDATIVYDNEGGIWLNQHRATATATCPTIAHISAKNGFDYNNIDGGVAHNNTNNSGIAISPDGKQLAVVGAGTQKLTIYNISKTDGQISLTKAHTISTAGSNHTALSWDYAGNLYVANRSKETITFYAMPYSGTVETPCASKYAFELEEIVANVYTLTTNVVGEGTIEGNAGSYVEGTTATLTATPAAHYDFVNWTYGSETSTANPLTITVNSDLTVTANFQEHAKYTITASAADNTMGYVTGGGTYYAGETVTLKAVANSTYCFVNWSDGNTDATRTFTATADVTLTANFAKASPRAWAYDLKMVEDGDNYKFSFNATTAANATLLFLDKEGNELYTAHEVGAVAAGANTVSIEKAYFTQVKDVYWSVKMDGEAISHVAEITDQTRGIYDFYNMMGVLVDNNPNSNEFGKIYIQASINGASDGATARSDAQKAGLFIYDQGLNELNPTSNVGIAPTVPSGYEWGAAYQFHRLAVDPKTSNLVYSYAIASKPAVFSMDRANLTGTPTNLLAGIDGLTRTVAHCFDAEGTLYVMDIASSKGTIYKIKDGVKTVFVQATGKFVNQYMSMTSDGRGGLWVSHNRGQLDTYYQLAHVASNGRIDWYVDQTSTHGFTGGAVRGALAYDAERHILAQGRNSTVEIFQVAYDATTGVPTLTKIATTPQVNKANIDALAFDYAGDLYVCNSGTEKFYKYTLPTADNICTVPAPESQAIIKEVRYTITVNTVGNGTATGAGEYVVGETATLTATPAEHHRFVNWTKGEEVVSTETTYSFVVTEDVTLTATFEAIPQYTISVSANDGEMGSVTGGGTYDEGSTATLTATPVGGYVFEKWSDDNTDNPRTITVNGAAAYTAIFKVAPARVFAYNLDVVDNGDETYTLSFIPNANATSGRVILYNDDTKAQIHEAPITGTIAKGVKSEVVISKSVLPAAGIVTWAVELTGEQVEKLTLLTKANDKANYGFNRPQGVAIDNNPASDFFGRIYIALPKAGGTGYSDTNYGIVVMDPQHKRLKSGVVANGDALGADGRYSMHRVAVNPTNGHVYYVRTSDSNEDVTGTAIYELTPDATNILTDGGTAKNVISGASDITNANSVCFDETGAMYVMANANYDSGASLGRVYKVVDGVATLFTPNSIELASRDNAIVPDGKGGFWAAQHRDNFDTFSHLLHITATGTVDYSIDKNSADASLLPVQPYTSGGKDYTNASYRGQVAYYSIDENNGLVAYGGGAKVSVFKVSYDGAGKPSLTAWQTISLLTQSTTAGVNVDGIAFDYAGNIIVMSATDERMYQYALPIESANTSLVPSPTSKAIKLGTIYTVEVAVNDPAMGTATGAGEYIAGETATLEATPAANHNFVNWTYGSETSTDNPLSLVVNSDITVTANFEPVQYTLIAPTNDEKKGTVTGAGTYNHGAVATLTATPAAGYKLLYWSDRSTENPRTITMTKNEAISAYFVKEYAEEPTFKIEKMWENTNVPASTTNGYQAVGWDGKIYMQNKTAGKIITYSSEEDTGTEYATSGLGQQIAVDEAGNLIVFNATFSTANPNAILIYQKGSTEGKAVSFTLKDPAACHFFSASGDIYSAEGGYVYFYCNGKTAINRLKITNGAATVADVTTDIVGGSIYAGGTQNHVMVDIFGNLVTHARSNSVNWINVYTNECKTFTLPSIKFGTLGGCSFELGGKELWAYHAGANNYSSEWNIYNMTDSKFLSDDDFYAVDKTGTTNYACNWLNVQVVDENTAYIYQFCPLKAMAVWKVTLERDDLQKFTVTATTNDPAMGTVIGSDTYYENATATLIATPNAGYMFVNWTQAGAEVSTNATYTFTVTEDVELVANFEPLPEITYELNGGVWNQYGWTSKKDMYDAFIADWKAYSGSTRGTKTYEDQYGIGKSNGGLPTTIQNGEPILEFMALPKWSWLAEFLDAIATEQGITTKTPSSADVHMRFALGNFFGEDNNKVGDPYVDAVDCSGDNASLSAFAPYWGQTFPMPTQPTEEVILNAPYKEGYLFKGWYAAPDFSGAEVTIVDETTNGTLYAKWREHRYTRNDVTNGNYGTICLPYGSSSYSGAEFYEIAYLELQADGVTPKGIWLDEVTGALEAGKPYIFKATSTPLIVNYEGDEELNPVTGVAGLTGTFDGITDETVLQGNYMIADNKFWLCGTGCWLNANRAYIEHDKLHANTTPVSPMPGRRRVMMGAAGTNQATGIDHLTENGAITPTIEGTYDVLGRKMNEPNNTGFYIVNGKKVVIVK